MIEFRYRAAWITAATLLLTACSPGRADLEAYVAEVKSRPGPPLDPLPVMQQFETFLYAANTMRDPFSVPKQADDSSGAGEGLRPDPDRRKEYLESFPLDGLTMVGSLGDGEGMVALVVDPERVVHRVVAGNYLGQAEGRVVGVSETGIDLMEIVPDGSGGWLERKATLALDDE